MGVATSAGGGMEGFQREVTPELILIKEWGEGTEGAQGPSGF